MAFGIKVEVWGDHALFTRPELSVERYSYDVPTPSACRGILEAILFKPAIRYTIDRIHVLNPIKATNIRRNEVSAKLLASSASAAMRGSDTPLYIDASANIQQRACPKKLLGCSSSLPAWGVWVEMW